MPKPLPIEIKHAIIKDLREGRLSHEEIAAKRLGDGRKNGTISKIAKKAQIPVRKQGRRKAKTFQQKPSSAIPAPLDDIELECFEPEVRLNLIDSALSQLKAILPETCDAKEIMEWSSALEKLLGQRRQEAPPTPPSNESDGFFEALEAKTPEIWIDVDAEVDVVQVDPIQHQTVEAPHLVDQE
jgi:hypothetical protein